MAGTAHESREAHSSSSRRRDKEPEDRSSRHRHRSRSRSKSREREREQQKSSRHREETEEERRERKRLKRDKEGREHKVRDRSRSRERSKRKRERGDRERGGVEVVDEDEDIWVEKGADAEAAISNIPSSDSLSLRSNPSNPTTASLPPTTTTGSFPHERDLWMLEPDTSAAPTSRPPPRDIPHSATAGTAQISPPRLKGEREGGEADFFSSFGTEHKRKDPADSKPDPSKVQVDHRELNTQLREGKKLDDYENTERKKAAAGGPGYQFRMRKLARLYEQAEEA